MNTSNRARDYLILAGGAGFVVALDQWLKYLIRTNLNFGQQWSPFPLVVPFVRLVHWNNTGAAFGIFPSGGLVFTLIAAAVSIAILVYYPRVPRHQVALRLALALQLGGAIGNLIDRLIYGTVIDFISVGSLPVFNLADASISLGVAVLVVTMFFDDRRRPAPVTVTGNSVANEQGHDDESSELERPVL